MMLEVDRRWTAHKHIRGELDLVASRTRRHTHQQRGVTLPQGSPRTTDWLMPSTTVRGWRALLCHCQLRPAASCVSEPILLSTCTFSHGPASLTGVALVSNIGGAYSSTGLASGA